MQLSSQLVDLRRRENFQLPHPPEVMVQRRSVLDVKGEVEYSDRETLQPDAVRLATKARRLLTLVADELG